MKCKPSNIYGTNPQQYKCEDCPNMWYQGQPIPECQFGATEKYDEEIRVESKESIKLIKNSKGWNYEIKVIDKENVENQLDRLDRITKRMQEKYPNDK
jgi:hypothetical protein